MAYRREDHSILGEMKAEIKDEPEDIKFENYLHEDCSVDIESYDVKPSVGQRRTIGYYNEVPCEEKAKDNFMSFVNTDDDEEAVEIIRNNWTEFCTICKNNGFWLYMEHEDDKMNIHLKEWPPFRQKVREWEKQPMKAFQEMETVLESKRKQYQNKKYQAELAKSKSEDHVPEPIYYVYRQKIVKPPTLIEYTGAMFLPSSLERYTSMTEQSAAILKTRDSFLKHSTMGMLLNNDSILEDICSRLTAYVEGTQNDPFSANPSYHRSPYSLMTKKMALLRYVRYLKSHDVNKQSTVEVMKLSKQFKLHSYLFCFVPRESLLAAKRDELVVKYKIYCNIVGSIHFLPFRNDSGYMSFLCLAILDKTVVCCSSGKTRGAAMENLYAEIKKMLTWNMKYKFITLLKVSGELEQMFLHHSLPELYQENEQVVMWMRRNFTNISTSIYGSHILALPAFYNSGMAYAETQEMLFGDPSERYQINSYNFFYFPNLSHR